MTPPTKSEQIRHLFEKMKESLLASEELLQKGHEEFAVSRAYYAMFYITEALLLTKDMAFSKHSGVMAAFNRHFVKTGVFSKDLHEMIKNAFEERTEGDYGVMAGFSPEDAQEAIERARTFCQSLTTYLEQLKVLP